MEHPSTVPSSMPAFRDRSVSDSPAADRRVPDHRVPDILARAAELDRDRLETSSIDALRSVAVDAGISLSSLEAALEEYAAKSERSAKSDRVGSSIAQGKSTRTGTVLAVFLGGFGAHRFYLGDKKGLFYLPFFWTLVPSVVSLVEAFFMPDRVRAFNRRAELIEAVRTHKLLTVSQAAAARERRPCPWCAELILPGAKICRFCEHILT